MPYNWTEIKVSQYKTIIYNVSLTKIPTKPSVVALQFSSNGMLSALETAA